MSTVYKWRPQAGIRINAQVAGEYLEKLRVRRNGQLTPQAVVEDARSRKSPLHKAFEWNDTRAAHEFRVWQARHLLNSIIVVVKGGRDEAKTEPARAFVSVRLDKKAKGYVSRARAMSESELREQMVDGAIREIVSWRNRYSDLHELNPIVRAIDQLVKKREKVSTKRARAA